MAPEQSHGEGNYDFKVDIYSMGLIFLEVYYPIGTSQERIEVFEYACDGIYPSEVAIRDEVNYIFIK